MTVSGSSASPGRSSAQTTHEPAAAYQARRAVRRPTRSRSFGAAILIALVAYLLGQ